MYYNGFEQLLKFFFAQNFGRGRGNWGDKPNTQRDIFNVDWLRLITSDLSYLYIQSLNPPSSPRPQFLRSKPVDNNPPDKCPINTITGDYNDLTK